jgi:hypothetical protein
MIDSCCYFPYTLSDFAERLQWRVTPYFGGQVTRLDLAAGYNKDRMRPGTITIRGTVVPGYRVASKELNDYPYGTIERQKPFFKSLGLDLDRFYSGTINISIGPATFTLKNPQYTFRKVAWTDLHPPEDFSFSRCHVVFKGKEYEGVIYYPHPETKKRHFENDSVLEVITAHIPDLGYGARIEVELQAAEVAVKLQSDGDIYL